MAKAIVPACLTGQYAYAGYMPNKPSYISRAIPSANPAPDTADEKVSCLLLHH